jgi:hypothetical protein
MPSGVSSIAHARTRAIGNPTASSTNTRRLVHSGSGMNDMNMSTTCSTTQLTMMYSAATR